MKWISAAPCPTILIYVIVVVVLTNLMTTSHGMVLTSTHIGGKRTMPNSRIRSRIHNIEIEVLTKLCIRNPVECRSAVPSRYQKRMLYDSGRLNAGDLSHRRMLEMMDHDLRRRQKN